MTDSGLLTGLTHLVEGRTRSISPENFHGEKGKGRYGDRGNRQKLCQRAGTGLENLAVRRYSGKGMADAGRNRRERIIQHIWLTCPHEDWRSFILRMYWDGEEVPSIEVAVGRFFLYGLV